MKENLKARPDEMSLKELILRFQRTFHFLLTKWKVILLVSVLGLLIGLTYTCLKSPLYEATISFITEAEQTNPNALGAYAGLAAQLGFNLNGDISETQLFQGENVYDLMKTQRMIASTLLTSVVINGEKTRLIDRYIAMKDLRKKWDGRPEYSQLSFDVPPSSFTRYHHKVIKGICKDILNDNLQFANQTGGTNNSSIMSVNCVSEDEYFSSYFLKALINNVAEFYINVKTQRARSVLNILTNRLDSVRTELYGTMTQVADLQDKNINLVKVEPRVQQQKGSLKLNVNSAIYQQLVGAVETAKLNLEKETPLFEIIDNPTFPLQKKKASWLIWGCLGLLAGGVLSSSYLLIQRFYRKIMSGQ